MNNFFSGIGTEKQTGEVTSRSSERYHLGMPKSPKVGCCLRYLFRQVGGGLGITWERFVETGGHLTTSPHIADIFVIYDNTINKCSCKYWTSTELCNTRAKNGTFPGKNVYKKCFCPKRQLFVKKNCGEVKN